MHNHYILPSKKLPPHCSSCGVTSPLRHERRKHQIRWVEVFDEIDNDLTVILSGLSQLTEKANLPFEVEMSALHLADLISEVK